MTILKDLLDRRLSVQAAYAVCGGMLLAFVVLNGFKISLFHSYLSGSEYIGNRYVDRLVVATDFQLTFLRTIAILLCLYYFMIRHGRCWLFISWFALQTLYISIYLLYYWYSFTYLRPFHMTQMLREGLTASASLLIVHNPRIFTVLLDLPMAVLLCLNFPAFKSMLAGLPRITGLGIAALGTLGILAMNLRFVPFYASQRDFYGEKNFVSRYGTLVNNVVDLIRYGSEKNKIVTLLPGRLQQYTPADLSPPKNIVLIQVESLMAHAVTAEYNGIPVMPYLSNLSKRSRYFPRTLALHEGGGTADAEFSILTSIPPSPDFAPFYLRSYTFDNSVLKVLKRCGYVTAAFHGNTGDFFNRSTAFPRMGFDRFYDIRAMGLKEEGWGLSDSTTFAFVCNTMAQEGRPFLYHIITLTSHAPFTYAQRFSVEQRFADIHCKVERDYLNSMAYVDRQLEHFVSWIESNIRNTVILIFGDHSVNVLGDNFCSIDSRIMVNNHLFEFVPLLIVGTDEYAYREAGNAATFLDIMPSIVAASGIAASIRTNGISLLDSLADGMVTLSAGTYTRSWLYALSANDHVPPAAANNKCGDCLVIQR